MAKKISDNKALLLCSAAGLLLKRCDPNAKPYPSHPADQPKWVNRMEEILAKLPMKDLEQLMDLVEQGPLERPSPEGVVLEESEHFCCGRPTVAVDRIYSKRPVRKCMVCQTVYDPDAIAQQREELATGDAPEGYGGSCEPAGDDSLSDHEFVQYLEGQLIPDLQESGQECTAEDFTRCVQMLKHYMPGPNTPVAAPRRTQEQINDATYGRLDSIGRRYSTHD